MWHQGISKDDTVVCAFEKYFKTAFERMEEFHLIYFLLRFQK